MKQNKPQPEADRPDFATRLKEDIRETLIHRIRQFVLMIEVNFCRQDCMPFRWPDKQHSISLDTDCVSAQDFQYPVMTTDLLGTEIPETRTAGKITLDGELNILLFPRDEGDRQALNAEELATDDLFRLCSFLESAYIQINKETKEIL